MGVTAAIIGASLLGAGATYYSSRQQAEAANRAAAEQARLADQQVAIQRETNALTEQYNNKQLEYNKQQSEWQKQFNESSLKQQEEATKRQQETSQRSIELQQEQMNKQQFAAPTYEENVNQDIKAMTESEKRRRAALSYAKTDKTGGLLSSGGAGADTLKKQLLGS